MKSTSALVLLFASFVLGTVLAVSAADPNPTDDETLSLAARFAGRQGFVVQMNDAAAQGYFSSASRTARRIYRQRLEMPSPHAASLGRDAGNVIELLTAEGKFDDARTFTLAAIDDLQSRDASAELLASFRQTAHALSVLQQDRRSGDATFSTRYEQLLRSIWIDAETDDSDPTRREAFELECQRLGPDHDWAINSMLGVSRQAIDERRSDIAEMLIGIFENGGGDSSRRMTPIKTPFRR